MTASILGFGVILRALLLVWPTTYWGDEWASIELSKGTLWRTIVNNALDTHPPLYFILLNIASRFIDHGFWVLRMPSILLGIGALFSTWLLANEVLDGRARRILLWFAAISPSLLDMSNFVRNHCAPVFFCALGSFFFIKLGREPNKRLWSVGFIVSALGALYSQHFSWIWLGTLFLLKPSRVFAKIIMGAIPMLALLLYNVVRYDRIYHHIPWAEWDLLTLLIDWGMIHYRFIWGQGLLQGFVDPSTWFIFVRSQSSLILKPLMIILWAYAVLLGAVRLLRAVGLKRMLVLCIPSVLILVIGSYHFIYLEKRYYSFLYVPMLVLFAYGVSFIRPRSARWAAIIFISFIMLIKSILLIESHSSVRFDEDRWRCLSRIYSQCQPGDAILNVDDGIFSFYRRWRQEPSGVRWVERASSADTDLWSGAPRAWVLGIDTMETTMVGLGYLKVRPYHLQRYYVSLYFHPQAARTAETT